MDARPKSIKNSELYNFNGQISSRKTISKDSHRAPSPVEAKINSDAIEKIEMNNLRISQVLASQKLLRHHHTRNFSLPSVANLVNGIESLDPTTNSANRSPNQEKTIKLKLKKSEFGSKSNFKPSTPQRRNEELEYARKQLCDLRGFFSQSNSNTVLSSGSSPLGGKIGPDQVIGDFSALEKRVLAKAMFEKDKTRRNNPKSLSRRDTSYVTDALSKPGTPRNAKAETSRDAPFLSSRDVAGTQYSQAPWLNSEILSQNPIKRPGTKSIDKAQSSFSRKAMTHRENLEADMSNLDSLGNTCITKKGERISDVRYETEMMNMNVSMYNSSRFNEQYTQNFNMGKYDKTEAYRYALDKKTLNFHRTFNIGNYDEPLIPRLRSNSPFRSKRQVTSVKEADDIKPEDELLMSLKKECPTVFSAVPAGRQDVLALSSWVEFKLNEVVRSNMEETEKCLKCDDIYNLCLNELLRQITLECAERGELFYRIWMSYYRLLVQFKSNVNIDGEAIKAEYNKNLEHQNEMFNTNFAKKNEEIQQLKQDLLASLDKSNVTQDKYDKLLHKEVKYKAKIDQLKSIAEHMKTQIEELKRENVTFSKRLTSKKTFTMEPRSKNSTSEYIRQGSEFKSIARQASNLGSEIHAGADGDKAQLSFMSSPRIFLNGDKIEPNQGFDKFDDILIEHENEDDQRDPDDQEEQEKQEDQEGQEEVQNDQGNIDSSEEEESTVSEVEFVFVDTATNTKQKYNFDQLNNKLLIQRSNEEEGIVLQPQLFDPDKESIGVQTSIILVGDKYDDIFEKQQIIEELLQERIIKRNVDKFAEDAENFLLEMNLDNQIDDKDKDIVDKLSIHELKNQLEAVKLPEKMINSLLYMKQEVLAARRSIMLMRQNSQQVSQQIEPSPTKDDDIESENSKSQIKRESVQGSQKSISQGRKESGDVGNSPNLANNTSVAERSTYFKFNSTKSLDENIETKGEHDQDAEDAGRRKLKRGTSLKKVQFSQTILHEREEEEHEEDTGKAGSIANTLILGKSQNLEVDKGEIENEEGGLESQMKKPTTVFQRSRTMKAHTTKPGQDDTEALPLAADLIANKKYVASQDNFSLSSGIDSPTKLRTSIASINENEDDDASEKEGDDAVVNPDPLKRRENKTENMMGDMFSSRSKLIMLAKIYRVEREKTIGLQTDLEEMKTLLGNEKQNVEKLSVTIDEQNVKIKRLEKLKDKCIHQVCPICGVDNNAGEENDELGESIKNADDKAIEGSLREVGDAGDDYEDNYDEDEDEEEEEEVEVVVNAETGETAMKKVKRQIKRRAAKQTTVATLPEFTRKKQKEQRINPALAIIATIKENGMRKFKNYMPIKSVLKHICLLYGARSPDSKEFALHKDEEFPKFVYTWFLNNFGFKKIAEQKFIVFVLSVKKYLYIVRINLFARFMGLLDGSSNYSLEEFNKYLEAADYVNKLNLGAPIQNNDTDSKHYIAYLKSADYMKFFAESKMLLEEYSEFRKGVEAIKETDPRGINRNGIVDFDLMMTKVLAKYRIICNRTKQNVVTAFKAADLDGNKHCSLKEFIVLYRNIEQDKYDYWFAETVFNEHADLKVEGELSLSFDKFTVVCVEYTLFSDAQQDQFLDVFTKDDAISRLQEIKEKWARQYEDIKESMAIMTRISKDEIDYWLRISEVVDKRIQETDDPSSPEVKPLLIAYKILTAEIEKLKEEDMDVDIYGVRKDKTRYHTIDTSFSRSQRGTVEGDERDFTEKIQKSPFFLEANAGKDRSRNTSRVNSRNNSRNDSRQNISRNSTARPFLGIEIKDTDLGESSMDKDRETPVGRVSSKKKSRMIPL